MGRKRIKIDPKKVRELASRGLGPTQIARALGVSWHTIDANRKRSKEFDEALERGRVEGLEKVTNSLFEQATSGNNVVSTIFYLKNRDPSNWMDRVETNHTLSIGSALDNARLRPENAPAKIIQGEVVDEQRVSAKRANDKKSLEPPKDA